MGVLEKGGRGLRRCGEDCGCALRVYHVELHLFDLLVSHDVDGLLSTLEVEFKLPLFFRQLQYFTFAWKQIIRRAWKARSPIPGEVIFLVRKRP
jgi:hypothetical protein